MDNFLMKPKIDFAFKEIMANEQARIGFLSAVLKIKPEELFIGTRYITVFCCYHL